MHLLTGQPLLLCDGHHRLLGRLVINQIEDNLVLGRFVAEPDFAFVRHLFAEFVEAVNQQLFHTVDELDQEIAVLGLHLGSANGSPLPAIEDVQIADDEISFRIQPNQLGPDTPAEATGSTRGKP
jgi:hypothetical protein